MQKKVVVIIGGPGTGKTTIINRLLDKGHCCYPEISREITLEAKKQGIEQLFLENPLLFSQKLLEGRKKQYKNALQEPHEIIFIDRGLPDIIAYMDFINSTYPKNFKAVCEACKYSEIFILPPWKSIYLTDQERYENFDESEKIYNHLRKTYTNFGYNLIEVPKDSVENRVLFILNKLQKL